MYFRSNIYYALLIKFLYVPLHGLPAFCVLTLGFSLAYLRKPCGLWLPADKFESMSFMLPLRVPSIHFGQSQTRGGPVLKSIMSEN